MRAVTVSTPGLPNALQVSDVPVPQVGPGDVLIRVEAAGVNPVDLMLRRGAFHDLGWITVPSVGVGLDVAGTVEAVGPDVAADGGLVVGARVATVLRFSPAPSLAYADLVAAPAADVAVVPEGLTAVQAATVPLNSLTAAQAIDLLGPARGRSLLITGAAGAVGGFAARMAVDAGFDVTALARPSDAEFVATTGATLVTELPRDASVDVVLDTAFLQSAAMAVVRDGGTYLGVVAITPMTPERDVVVHTVGYTPDGPRLTALLARTAEGGFPVRIAATVPLAEAVRAHELAETPGLRGRVVLVP